MDFLNAINPKLVASLCFMLLLSACAQTGYEPNPPLQLAKNEFVCTMDSSHKDRKTVDIAPFQYLVKIDASGRRAVVKRDGRTFRVGYSGQGLTSLPNTAKRYRVNYTGKDAGELVMLSVPNRARSGHGTYAEFKRNRIRQFSMGDCV